MTSCKTFTQRAIIPFNPFRILEQEFEMSNRRNYEKDIEEKEYFYHQIMTIVSCLHFCCVKLLRKEQRYFLYFGRAPKLFLDAIISFHPFHIKRYHSFWLNFLLPFFRFSVFAIGFHSSGSQQSFRNVVVFHSQIRKSGRRDSIE